MSADTPTAVEIVPGVVQVSLSFSNVFLCDTADGVVLVDAGCAGEGDAILAALSGLGRTSRDLRTIVLTHAHPDHIGAAAELVDATGAQVSAATADADAIEGTVPRPEPQLTEAEKTWFPKMAAAAPEPPACRVDRRLADGDEVAPGVTVVAVPGHTPGSVAVLVADGTCVLCGDAAAQFDGRVVVGGLSADPPASVRAVERLAGLGTAAAGFGHGDPVRTGAAERLAAAARAAE